MTVVQRFRKLQCLGAAFERLTRLAAEHQRLSFGREDQCAFRAWRLFGD
jgi:hypothetical protein